MALAAGLSSANYALERGFGFQKKTSGPWSGWVRATAPSADPYTKAHFSRNGIIPPPPLESLQFKASRDNTGRPITGECEYVISGAFPPARRWTVAVYDSTGQLVDNPAKRFAFSNRTVVYNSDGTVTISIGADPKPGNWLPMGRVGDYAITLAVYDTPLATEAFLTDTTLPDLRRQGCRT